MIVIDKLCYLSKLRYVNPIEKFAFAVLTLIFLVVSRSIAMGVMVLILNGYLTVRLGGIPSRRYVHLMVVPLTFIVLSILAIIINISKVPLEAFAIPVGSYYITSGWDNIMRCLQLVVTAMSSVSCLYFLALNTTMTDILGVMRKLYCPKLMCELMLLIYRFIFVLLDTAYHIKTAQTARLGYGTYKKSLNDFSSLVQTLFIRSMKKSNALYDSMEARGYDGEINVLEENYPISKRNVLLITLFESALLLMVIWIKLKG